MFVCLLKVYNNIVKWWFTDLQKTKRQETKNNCKKIIMLTISNCIERLRNKAVFRTGIRIHWVAGSGFIELLDPDSLSCWIRTRIQNTDGNLNPGVKIALLFWKKYEETSSFSSEWSFPHFGIYFFMRKTLPSQQFQIVESDTYKIQRELKFLEKWNFEPQDLDPYLFILFLA